MIGWYILLCYQAMIFGLKVFGLVAWAWWVVLLPVEFLGVAGGLFIIGLVLQGAVGRNPFQ